MVRQLELLHSCDTGDFIIYLRTCFNNFPCIISWGIIQSPIRYPWIFYICVCPHIICVVGHCLNITSYYLICQCMLPKKLTEMQIKFAQLLVTNEGRKTPTECAIEAGYNKDRATITASELQSSKKISIGC